MMRRDDCLKCLARHHTDQIVVAVYQAAFEWIRIKPHPLNYISTGAMGQASSHALGLALGRPDKRVIVLDGDGSLLMNLGSLVTIAAAAPPNLVHFLCENGTYEANGGHPVPGAGKVDFPGLARAAGYRAALRIETIDTFDEALPALLESPGPVFASLVVEPGEAYPQDYEDMHSAERRARFRAALRES
ncbi:MAG: thiamine pyrophosphate-binding protein [Planctomycetes bacterium]|nr:thiamine pyrophosphate-binding protein [Planctomycetota bacterium]